MKQSSQAHPAIHSLAVANLDSLFERAVLGWSKPDAKGDANIKTIHQFFAPVLVDGKAMMAKMTVKETSIDSDPNSHYTVEAVAFDEIKTLRLNGSPHLPTPMALA